MATAIDIMDGSRLGDALRGAGIPPGTSTFVDEVTTALRAGGAAGARQLPQGMGRLGQSFNLTSPGAVEYLQTTLPSMIREIDENTREGVREAVLRGMTEGRPAPRVARDVRDLVGLTESQAAYVARFREQLETGEIGGATPPWERRLDAISRQRARRLFREPTSRVADIDALVDRYRQSLVNKRAKDISRTEINRAFSDGQRAMWGQAADDGLLDRGETRRQWLYTPDDVVREDHTMVPGMNPGGIPLDGLYDTPAGQVLGPRNGGPPEFSINCRCTEILLFSGDE